MLDGFPGLWRRTAVFLITIAMGMEIAGDRRGQVLIPQSFPFIIQEGTQVCLCKAPGEVLGCPVIGFCSRMASD